MAVIDIIVIGVLLVFGIIGMIKGFLNTIISLFGNLASLAVAVICAKPVASFLDKIFGIVKGIGAKIAGSLTGITPFASAESAGAGLSQLSGEQLKTYLSNDGLTFQERFMSLFIEDSKIFTTDAEVVSYIGEKIAGVVALVIAAVVMFIILRLAIFLLAKLFDAITKNKAIGGLDRAMGLITGLVKGGLIVSVVLGAFYLIANTTVTGWIENSVVTKFVYQYICQFIDWGVTQFNLPEIITNLFPTLSDSSALIR